MGQAGKNLVGVLMVLVFAGLLVGWIVLRQQLVSTETFYHLSVTPGGGVLVPTDNHLLHIAADGEQQILALEKLGLAGHFGRFAPIDDDAFIALHVPDANTSVLKRCSLSSRYCEKMAATGFFPEYAYRIYWLPDLNLLLAVDNAGHRLVLLDQAGQVVDELKGFRFPGGVHVDANRVFLADTNHHRVVELAVSSDGFQGELAEHEISRSREHRWPVEVHPDPWGWVVQVAGDAMGDDIVAAYSTGWGEEPAVDPAGGRDVISSAHADGWLYLALDDRQVYRTRAPYTDLQRLPPGAASDFLDALAQEYASRRLGLQALQVIGLLMFALGLYVAWRLDGARFMALQE